MTGGPTAPPAADLDPAVALAMALMARASVTPDDRGCQALIAARLDTAGFSCESMPFADVSNLWARVGDEAPVFCFAGHTDVVPAGDLGAWDSDPFRPEIRGGHLYGRGAADMKSGLAAQVVAAERFLAAHPSFRGSLAFLVTSDEEGDAVNGTRKVIETLTSRGERIDWCLIGEPSSARRLGDTIRIGRRGSLTGDLTVGGVAGHVAYPDLLDNPVRAMAPVLHALYERVWDQGNADFPPTGFQVTRLDAGGNAPNVTPERFRMRFNFRYSTEWDHRSLRQALESTLADHGIEFTIDWHLSGEPFLTRRGAFTDAVRQAIQETTGANADCSTGGGTSDGRFIAPAGADVVEFGPVNATIHQANECVALEDVRQLAAAYQAIIERMLLGVRR